MTPIAISGIDRPGKEDDPNLAGREFSYGVRSGRLSCIVFSSST
jgi:hypothetical protein